MKNAWKCLGPQTQVRGWWSGKVRTIFPEFPRFPRATLITEGLQINSLRLRFILFFRWFPGRKTVFLDPSSGKIRRGAENLLNVPKHMYFKVFIPGDLGIDPITFRCWSTLWPLSSSAVHLEKIEDGQWSAGSTRWSQVQRKVIITAGSPRDRFYWAVALQLAWGSPICMPRSQSVSSWTKT